MSEIGLLVELVKANHSSVMERLDGLEETFKEQRQFCDGRFDDVEVDVKKHDRSISRSKGMITIISVIWGGIVLVASLFVRTLWR